MTPTLNEDIVLKLARCSPKEQEALARDIDREIRILTLPSTEKDLKNGTSSLESPYPSLDLSLRHALHQLGYCPEWMRELIEYRVFGEMEDIWPPFVLTDEQLAELDRRGKELDDHPERGIPVEVAFARLRQKLADRK